MDESTVRSLFRDAMSSKLARLPAAPGWEELQTQAGIGTHQHHTLAPIGAGIVALALVVLVLFAVDTAPIDVDSSSPPFDGASAADAGRAWWRAVIDGDLAQARSIAHPDAEFNYPGLQVAVGGFLDPVVSIGEDVFGTPAQPQLCFAVAGRTTSLTGSLVFRMSGAEWLLWEVRTGVEHCEVSSPTSTLLPAPGVTARTTELLTSEAIPVRELTIPLRVLAVRPNNPSLALLNFDKGVLTVYPPGSHRLPLDAVDGAVAAPNGDMIIWTQGVARLFRATLDGDVVVLGPTVVRHIEGIAPALRVVPSPDGLTAWLVQPGFIGAGESHLTLVELVELPSGRLLRSYELDPNTFPVGATGTGLILNVRARGLLGPGAPTPGNDLVVRLSPDGSVAVLYEGHAIAVSAAKVVMLVGERLVIGNDAGGDSHDVLKPVPGMWSDVGGPGVPSDAMPLQTMSPDGSALLIGLVPDPSAYPMPYVVDLETNEVTALMIESPDGQALATWSSDGEWIVLVDQRDIELISWSDPTDRFFLPDVVPADHWVLAAG